MKRLAEELKDEHSLLFFARGYNYATAVEAALKVKVRAAGPGSVVALGGVAVQCRV